MKNNLVFKILSISLLVLDAIFVIFAVTELILTQINISLISFPLLSVFLVVLAVNIIYIIYVLFVLIAK